MQEAIPYKRWMIMPGENPLHKSLSLSLTNQINPLTPSSSEEKRDLKKMVKENAVVIFGKRGCCMSHVVKRLLQGLGVNPPAVEVDDKDEVGVIDELEMMGSVEDRQPGRVQFPAVFIGGELFGGLDRVMATHITGELTPILKNAGALWL